MAVYRQVHIEFWQDGFVLELTPEEKYFYLYLMTNSKTSQCGIYELPKRIIETETGYNRETVEKLLNRFEEYKKISYDKETNEIFLNNWVKYNKIKSPKVIRCVEKEVAAVKSNILRNVFINECKKHGYDIDTKNIETIDRVCIPMSEIKNNLKDHYREEKEKEKEKEEEKYKEKEADEKITVGRYIKNNISDFAKLFEENIGLINGVIRDWLVEVSDSIDVRLFKRAIEIATHNGSCNMGYVNGIVKQWRNNNIKTLEDLNAYKLSKEKQGGDSFGGCKKIVDEEDADLYRKPTEEELYEFRKFLEENTKL
ncbi:MAG: DnaD domain protein [Paeniclostridium sordellii]|nr:DnaD domain protein [Paeniclostridium sordellii]